MGKYFDNEISFITGTGDIHQEVLNSLTEEEDVEIHKEKLQNGVQRIFVNTDTVNENTPLLKTIMEVQEDIKK